MLQRAYVALGSNLGDRAAHLRAALAGLAATPGVERVVASAVYETEPLGPPQGRYLNAVVAFDTTRAPHALLARLAELERAAGRVRGPRNAPRTLDLDLLLVGDACLDEPELVLPHPRLHERAFVLVPLAELAAEVVHPRLGVRIGELLARLPSRGGVRPYAARLS
jgi:2-amino-4-hydroxy-6-hydroxymethyldihydropteridine diphosphokinase